MKKFIFFLTILLFTSFAWAETVTLTSGKVVDGEVIEITEDYVKIDTGEKVWKVRFKFMEDESKQRMMEFPSPVALLETPETEAPPQVPIETQSPSESPTITLESVDSPAYHTGTAQGEIQGREFTVEKARLTLKGTVLELRQGEEFFPDLAFQIFLFNPKDGGTWENKELHITPQSSGSKPHIYKKWMPPGAKTPETKGYTSGYSLDISFQGIHDGRISGMIDLRLQDEFNSYVQGPFEAEVEGKSGSGSGVVRETVGSKDMARALSGKQKTLLGLSGGAALLLGLVGCFIACFPFYLISQKTGIGNPFLAFIPLLNFFLFLELAEKPAWWIILLFVPFVNIVVILAIYCGIAETTGNPAWQGLLVLVPGINIVIPWYWALNCADGGSGPFGGDSTGGKPLDNIGPKLNFPDRN